MAFEHAYVILSDGPLEGLEVRFFEDNIDDVKRALKYLVENYPGRAYAVFKQINVVSEGEKIEKA